VCKTVFGGVFMSQRRRTCGGCDAGGWRPTPRPKRRGRAALPGGSGPLYTTLSLDNQKTTDKSFPFKRSLAFVRRRRLGNKRMYNVAVVRYQYNHFCRTRALIRPGKMPPGFYCEPGAASGCASYVGTSPLLFRGALPKWVLRAQPTVVSGQRR